MIRTVPNLMERYGCSAETAQRYMDLREEGYPQHEALLMAGLSDPPDPDMTRTTKEQFIDFAGDEPEERVCRTDGRCQYAIDCAVEELGHCPKGKCAMPAPVECSPEFTDTARAALLWVLWHHQGGSSKVGQPIRFALGMGQHDRLNEHQIRQAKIWGELVAGKEYS